MEKRNRMIPIRSMVVILAMVIAACGMVPAAAREIPICTNNSSQVLPDIDGELIVWMDYRNGNYDIYLYNLTSGEERPICTDPADQWDPVISENWIVWDDERNGNHDIYLYDLSTGQEMEICTERHAQRHPAVNEGQIVWQDLRHGSYTIYTYDFTLKEDVKVSDHYGTVHPDINDEWLVYESGGDIYAWYIPTGRYVRLSIPDEQNHPKIWGDRVVWTDYREVTQSDIYMYDLTTENETPICTNNSSQAMPAIDGDLITWEDRRNGDKEIYLFNISSGAETRITDDPAWQSDPSISGGRIVWEDHRNGNPDIYLYTPEDGPGFIPVADFRANRTVGTAPLTVEFNDTSSGMPESWAWEFGDGATSEEQNPVHTYGLPGTYTVSLTVSTATGSDTMTKPDYIRVAEPVGALHLYEGWNFISVPQRLAPGSSTVTEVFTDVDMAGNEILLYEPGEGFIPMAADNELRPLDGIWIYANASSVVDLIYDDDPVSPPPEKHLLSGWNAIGFTGSSDRTAGTALISVRDAWRYLIGYDAAGQFYELTIVNNESDPAEVSDPVHPMKGYWIFMERDGVLGSPVPGTLTSRIMSIAPGIIWNRNTTTPSPPHPPGGG
ncbi:PKD domain-containing protein [Methanofollis fontis]|nr:PKD domain-containing protein [Methanofollis fontis]